ncbi:MAG: hypothetical protein WCH84_11260 [Verrucomicrobiota bacterium]
MKYIAWLLALWLAGSGLGRADANGLESIFDGAGAVWKLEADNFLTRYRGLGFHWVAANNHDAAATTRPALTFAGLPVLETIARFEQNALKELTASLYNRGDAGDLSEAEFQKLVERVETNLTAWAGTKGTLFKDQERTTVITLHRKSWIKGPHRLDLVWSYSEKSRRQGVAEPRPEFVRLIVTAFDPAHDPRNYATAATAPSQTKYISPAELRARVKHAANGDVVITGVPMVDQGKKGYCAAAVAERLLRYYGRTLDQHEIAQLANTTAGAGTKPEQMVAAFRRISTETRMDVGVLHEFNLHEFEQLLNDYNRAAKKARKPEVNLMLQRGDALMVYREMDPALLKEARLKRDAQLANFKTTINKSIANGVPLSWGCVLGVAKEKPEVKGFGGHFRLIIGYNDRTQEILYTDTWGAGHELKRLPLADAWMITLGLYNMQPSDLHF